MKKIRVNPRVFLWQKHAFEKGVRFRRGIGFVDSEEFPAGDEFFEEGGGFRGGV